MPNRHARMQYTASSFAQPLTDTFDLLLQTRRVVIPPQWLVSEGGQFRYGDSRSVSGTHLSAAVPRISAATCCAFDRYSKGRFSFTYCISPSLSWCSCSGSSRNA